MRVTVEAGLRREWERTHRSCWGHAKCTTEVCVCEFTGKILPQVCNFSPGTVSGSGAGGEGSTRVMGQRDKGAGKLERLQGED